jgi:hypothetical protein
MVFKTGKEAASVALPKAKKLAPEKADAIASAKRGFIPPST